MAIGYLVDAAAFPTCCILSLLSRYAGPVSPIVSPSAACDLPLRPNEAHIFYSNMSKVLVSLLGRTRSADREESEHDKPQLPSDSHSLQTERYYKNN